MSSAADRVAILVDELGIFGPVRAAMVADPDRALAVLDTARRAPGIRNRAAFAITHWRRRDIVRPDLAEAEDAWAQPPSLPPNLAAIEHAWAQPPTVVGGLILKLLAIALERHGGFAGLRAELDRHRTGTA